MNENVDFFKDQKEQLMNAVDKAILQAEIMQDVIPSKALDKLLTQLGIIKNLYPGYFRQFILNQCIEDGKLKTQDFVLELGNSSTFFKITVEQKKNIEETNLKKKWYNF